MPNFVSILRENARSLSLGADTRSRLRLAADVLYSRLLRLMKPSSYNATRRVVLNGGTPSITA